VTAALSAGVAIVRAARNRPPAGGPRDRHRLGLLAGEHPAAGVRRMALAQLELAIAMLAGDATAPLEAAEVHEMRKALKRLRALLRLARAPLGESRYADADAVARHAGHTLSLARDAEVTLETLERMIARHPRKLDRAGVRRLRSRLADEREQSRVRTLTDGAERANLLDELRACRSRLTAWQPESGASAGLQPGVRSLYRDGRARRRRAERAKGSGSRRLHEWRKRVKDLRYAAEALAPAEAPEERLAHKRKARSERRRAQHARRARRRLTRLAARADRLAETLGEHHDLGVLDAWVARQAGAPGGPVGRRGARRLKKLIAQRRAKLRRRALRDGARLYADRPKRFARRVSRASREAS
jgi:CHAD domain-containing protein